MVFRASVTQGQFNLCSLSRTVSVHLYITAKKKIAADDTLNFSLLSSEENKAWYFMLILCLAEDSHKISSIIFSEKQ